MGHKCEMSGCGFDCVSGPYEVSMVLLVKCKLAAESRYWLYIGQEKGGELVKDAF